MATLSSAHSTRPGPRFSTVSNLKLTKHDQDVMDLIKHTMKKSHKCFWNPANWGRARSDCNIQLSCFFLLEKHTLKHAETSYDTSKRKWCCYLPSCNYREYDSQNELNDHIGRSHLQSRYLFCPIKTCQEVSKSPEKLVSHFQTHGFDLTALADELAPQYKGVLVTLEPTPPLPHEVETYSASLPITHKARKGGRHMRRPRQQIDDEDMRTSLFGSVRSDSDSRPTTVTSPNLARLPPSPRKKRGARLTGNLVVDDVERRRPTDDELLYGDAPGGEYAPRGGYTSWEPTHWLDFEKPETEFYKNPLPPVNHIIRSNYASPPSLQLDREPIIITQHMCAAEPGRKSSMRADETTSKLQQSQSELGPDTATLESNGAQTQRPPPIGFRSFWQSVRQTPLGQTLETALAEEAEKEAEREVAAQIVVDSGEERSSSSAPASVASNRHLDASGSPTPPRRKPGAQTARKTNTKTLLSGVATTSTRRSASSTTPNDVNATRRIHRARKTGAKSSNRMRIISPMSERREET